MERKAKSELAIQGIGVVLTVDTMSDSLVDLYLPKDAWRHLVNRFKGNKMTVCLRGPHDYKRGMIPPPDHVMNKLKTWIAEDGTLDGITDIVTELTENV